MNTETLMELHDVHICIPARYSWCGKPRKFIHVLNGIDLTILRGETLGIIGESGCGKSTLARVMMGMLQPVRGKLVSAWQNRQAKGIQMVFQDLQSSLNPRLPLWRIMTEPVYIQQRSSADARRALAQSLAYQVGISPQYLDSFPHQLSGGQRQRIAIARALSAKPEMIVLDEPTSALDISVQAQILNLLLELQRQYNLTCVIISHNLSVIKHMSNRIAVMYLGQLVELGPSETVLLKPQHPYTRLLLNSVPRTGHSSHSSPVVTGELPSNLELPTGCFFYQPCAERGEGCQELQQLRHNDNMHNAVVRCHRASRKMLP